MLGQRGGHVDDALVAAATETQRGVALSDHKGRVDKRVDIVHDGRQRRVTLDLLPGVSGVAPNVVAQLTLDAFG